MLLWSAARGDLDLYHLLDVQPGTTYEGQLPFVTQQGHAGLTRDYYITASIHDTAIHLTGIIWTDVAGKLGQMNVKRRHQTNSQFETAPTEMLLPPRRSLQTMGVCLPPKVGAQVVFEGCMHETTAC